MSDAAEDWNKAERLAVAGAVAPRLRSQDDKTKSRRVALVDKDGKVTGYTTLAEVQKSLLKAREIELDVQDGVRPKEVVCRACGRTRKVGRGPVPMVCRNGCDTRCGTDGCSGRIAAATAVRAAIEGKLRICRACSMRRLHEASSRSTHEERAEQGRKGKAAMAALSPEERRKKLAARARPTAESYRAREAIKTPEQKAETRRKAWETRRAKAAKKDESQ
jgi:hypothetical protein